MHIVVIIVQTLELGGGEEQGRRKVETGVETPILRDGGRKVY